MVLIYVSQTSGDAIFCLGSWSTVVETMVVWMLGGTKSLFQTMLTYRNIKHKLELNIIFFIRHLFFFEINGLNYAFCVNSQERSLNEIDKHFYPDLCDTDQYTDRRINVRRYAKYIWHYWNISSTPLQWQIYKRYIQPRVIAIRLKKHIW